MLEKVKFFRPHFTDRAMQKFGHLFPSHLPPRMKNWRDKYEHHLLLKMAGDGVAEAQRWLNEFLNPLRAVSSPVRRKKAAKPSCTASPLLARRFVIRPYTLMKWKISWRWISLCAATIPTGSSICRRKSTANWYINSITATLCATFFIRTIS